MDKENKSRKEKNQEPEPLEMSPKLRALFEERKKAKREPLTPEKLRKTPGLEHLTDEQADNAIDSIKKLAAILFEMAAHHESKKNENTTN